MLGVWAKGFAPRARDEGPNTRFPSALLCMHCLLPAAPKGRSIRDQGGTALLQSRLRERTVHDAAGQSQR